MKFKRFAGVRKTKCSLPGGLGPDLGAGERRGSLWVPPLRKRAPPASPAGFPKQKELRRRVRRASRNKKSSAGESGGLPERKRGPPESPASLPKEKEVRRRVRRASRKKKRS